MENLTSISLKYLGKSISIPDWNDTLAEMAIFSNEFKQWIVLNVMFVTKGL